MEEGNEDGVVDMNGEEYAGWFVSLAMHACCLIWCLHMVVMWVVD